MLECQQRRTIDDVWRVRREHDIESASSCDISVSRTYPGVGVLHQAKADQLVQMTMAAVGRAIMPGDTMRNTRNVPGSSVATNRCR